MFIHSHLYAVSGTFSSETPIACLFEQNVYTLEPGKVQVRNFQVHILQNMLFRHSWLVFLKGYSEAAAEFY
jgi:hypothetical protein